MPGCSTRQLKNEETGLDLQVSSAKEAEGPLGGISIEYCIEINSKLKCFKAPEDKEEDVVHFSVSKTYRECEDFHNKLKKKFPQVVLPALIPSGQNHKNDVEERRKALDIFLQAVAENLILCSSPLLFQFLGFDGNKKLDAAATHSAGIPETKDVECQTIQSAKAKLQETQHLIAEKSPASEGSEDADAIGPKPSVSPKKPSTKEESKEGQQASLANERNDEFDIFEEMRQEQKYSSLPQADKVPMPAFLGQHSKHRWNSGGLFDNEPQNEDDGTSGGSTTPKNTLIKKKSTVPLFDESDEEPKEVERKGPIALFDEQDFGGAITKEEEPFFLVSGSRVDTRPYVTEVKSMEDDAELFIIDTSLSDLLGPKSSVPVKQSFDGTSVAKVGPATADGDSKLMTESAIPDEKTLQTPRPLPKPRTKVPPRGDHSIQQPKSPEAIRKPKPTPPPKPQRRSLEAKRQLPPKPAVAPRLSADNQRAKKELLPSKPEVDSLDILQYIEKEQQANPSDVSLFD